MVIRSWLRPTTLRRVNRSGFMPNRAFDMKKRWAVSDRGQLPRSMEIEFLLKEGPAFSSALILSTGELLWRRDIVADVGSDRTTDLNLVTWGRSGSPLVVDNKVVVPGGGRTGQCVSLIAYDRESGTEVWRGGTDQISYSSPDLMRLAGREQIVVVNEGAVAGYDPETGSELWRHERTGHSSSDANTSQPRQVGEDRLLVTKGYSLGAELLKLELTEEGNFNASQVWQNRRVLRTKLTSAVVHGALAFGLNEGILECVDLTNGERLWKSGRFRHGQILVVGDDLLVLSEDGQLYQMPASREKPEMPPALPALYGITWNNLCLWKDYLLVRNSRQAACFRVGLKQTDKRSSGSPTLGDGPTNPAPTQ